MTSIPFHTGIAGDGGGGVLGRGWEGVGTHPLTQQREARETRAPSSAVSVRAGASDVRAIRPARY